MGLMLGVELVRETRITKEPASSEAADILEACKDRGLLIGKRGLYGSQQLLRIKPPMCLTKDDADLLADCLDEVLGGMAGRGGRSDAFPYHPPNRRVETTSIVSHPPLLHPSRSLAVVPKGGGSPPPDGSILWSNELHEAAVDVVTSWPCDPSCSTLAWTSAPAVPINSGRP